MEIAVIALVIAAFALRLGSPASPVIAGGGGGAPPPKSGTPSVGTVIGAVPVAVGGIKAVGTIGTAVGGAVSGGGAAASGGAVAAGGEAAAGGGAATAGGGASFAVGLGVAAAMAALIAGAKWYEAVSDRAVNARVLEQALERILRAILAEMEARGLTPGAAAAVAREWSATVSNELKQYLPISAAWVTAQFRLAATARAANPDAPKWLDLVRGQLDNGWQLTTPLPILAGNAYGISYVFDFFRAFPSAPYFIDTDWTARRSRTGELLPPVSQDTMASDFGEATFADLQRRITAALPGNYSAPEPVDYSQWNAGGG